MNGAALAEWGGGGVCKGALGSHLAHLFVEDVTQVGDVLEDGDVAGDAAVGRNGAWGGGGRGGGGASPDPHPWGGGKWGG